jgi:hypothetical protein
MRRNLLHVSQTVETKALEHAKMAYVTQALASWSLQLLSSYSLWLGSEQSSASNRPGAEESEAERAAHFAGAFELLMYLTELLDHLNSSRIPEACSPSRLYAQNAICMESPKCCSWLIRVGLSNV